MADPAFAAEQEALYANHRTGMLTGVGADLIGSHFKP